jgi:outer membrane protein OmpA-like peptidoglycan-associated protein
MVEALLGAASARDARRGSSLANTPESPAVMTALLRDLEAELASGTITVVQERAPIVNRPAQPIPRAPASPPPPRETSDTFFEVRLLDETGQGIGRVPILIRAGGKTHEVRTNAGGVALVENVTAWTAELETPELEPLENALDARWVKFRPQRAPKVSNMVSLPFTGRRLPSFPLKAAVPNTVVITPPSGKLNVSLWDKTGLVRHALRSYTIDGPMTFSGKTDENATLLHDDVFPGDYVLTLTARFFEDEDEQADTYDVPLRVLPNSLAPEIRMVGAVPRLVLVRFRRAFNTNKAFLLPTALSAVHVLRDVYRENRGSKLLVVGHADTAGGSAYNERLSVDRAQATTEFLADDVDGWLARYDAGIEKKKRWGAQEDRLMLMALPGFRSKPKGEDAVRWFQRTRGLEVDGIPGPKTRKALCSEYMSLDGTSLEKEGLDIETEVHGCGENHPLDDGGAALDEGAEDGVHDPVDRRVELLFFDSEFGFVPPPPGKTSKAGSKQYPKWVKRADVIDLVALDPDGPSLQVVEVADTLFRTNSAVVMPEGETPTAGAGGTATDAIATVLRFNASRPGKKVLVAGHTDTEGSVDFNQKLSEERAKCALALLVGGTDGRESFAKVCDGRHQVADYKQILAWVSRVLGKLGFDCHPGAIDDNAATGVAPVKRFQKSYNQSKSALGASGPDLAVDGAVGPLTWGAFFDCYEAVLAEDLGVDAKGLSDLREKVVFVDDHRRALGFGEHFPVEELGVDGLRSEANRRVEILLFDPTEEPDAEDAENDPETAELYLPGNYERVVVPQEETELLVRLHDSSATPLASAPFRVSLGTDVLSQGTSVDGRVQVTLPSGMCPEKLRLEWGELDAAGAFPFSSDVIVDCDDGSGRVRDSSRLANIGYPSSSDAQFDAAVRRFQLDYLIDEKPSPEGTLPPLTAKKLREIFTGALDASRPPPKDEPEPASGEDEADQSAGAGGCSLV